MVPREPGDGGRFRDHPAARLRAPSSPRCSRRTGTELDPRACSQPPSASHLFGTGKFGEDIFSRVLFGARYDLLIGFGAWRSGCARLPLGAAAGFIGGAIDEVVMRIMDMLSAFPGFILAMGIAGALGQPAQPVIAIALVNVPIYARLMRGSFLVVKAGASTRPPRSASARTRADPALAPAAEHLGRRSSSSPRSSSATRSSTRRASASSASA